MSDDYASKGGAPRLKSQFAGPDLREPIKAEPKLEPAEPKSTAPQTYSRQQVIKTCHQFDLRPHYGDMGTFMFTMVPQRLFKPQGITVFGLGYCELTLDVEQDRIFHGITSAFFRNQIPYTDLLEQVRALQQTGGYTADVAMAEVLERLQRGTARFQPTFRTYPLGSIITLRTEGVVPDAVVLWGDSL